MITRILLTSAAAAAGVADDLVEVGQDQGVLRHPPVPDDARPVDDEDGTFRQSRVPPPDGVPDAVALAHHPVPVRQQREIDVKRRGECLLREGGGDRHSENLGTELPQLGGALPQLGQF